MPSGPMYKPAVATHSPSLQPVIFRLAGTSAAFPQTTDLNSVSLPEAKGTKKTALAVTTVIDPTTGYQP